MTFDEFKLLKETNYEHAKGYLRFYGKPENKKVTNTYISDEQVLMTDFIHYYGLSKSDKIYYKNIKSRYLLYNRKKGSLTLVGTGNRLPVSTPKLCTLSPQEHNWFPETFVPEIIKDYPYLEWALDPKTIPYVKNTLQWLVRRKVSSLRKYFTLIYPNIPAATALRIVALGMNYGLADSYLQDAHTWLSNPEDVDVAIATLKGETIMHSDIKRMASLLKMKGNARWSSKRFHRFHDELTKELNRRKLLYFVDAEIPIPLWAKEIDLLPQQEIITSRARLVGEGEKMNHCVASYESKILDGDCVIISGTTGNTPYTMQVSLKQVLYDNKKKFVLQVNQNVTVGNQMYLERKNVEEVFMALNAGFFSGNHLGSYAITAGPFFDGLPF